MTLLGWSVSLWIIIILNKLGYFTISGIEYNFRFKKNIKKLLNDPIHCYSTIISPYMNQSTRLFLVHSPHLGVHVESADLAAWGSQPAMGRETNNHWVRISIENLYDYHPNIESKSVVFPVKSVNVQLSQLQDWRIFYGSKIMIQSNHELGHVW